VVGQEHLRAIDRQFQRWVVCLTNRTGTGGDGKRWTFPAIESFFGFLQSRESSRESSNAHGFLTRHSGSADLSAEIHREIPDMLATHAGVLARLRACSNKNVMLLRAGLQIRACCILHSVPYNTMNNCRKTRRRTTRFCREVCRRVSRCGRTPLGVPPLRLFSFLATRDLRLFGHGGKTYAK